ncbi:MAG: hypothetical protein K9K67_13320 [Bacteriovoracaceae bacterium]|nr:hypothetical protein [Bacteriovoracaceae bacterium]
MNSLIDPWKLFGTMIPDIDKRPKNFKIGLELSSDQIENTDHLFEELMDLCEEIQAISFDLGDKEVLSVLKELIKIRDRLL